MNERNLMIIREILRHLDGLEGGQAEEPLIHAAAQHGMCRQGREAPSLAEFEGCLHYCDEHKWVRGLPARITGRMKWALQDLGKDALQELN